MASIPVEVYRVTFARGTGLSSILAVYSGRLHLLLLSVVITKGVQYVAAN